MTVSILERTHEKEIFKIAAEMSKQGLEATFISNAIQTALKYEGVFDLFKLWAAEHQTDERAEIIADIQDMIDDCAQRGMEDLPSIRFNDLEAIAKDIRRFKDSLLQMILEKGGIKNLSERTGIPQPSLSRFFKTASMPQRGTLLKIAKALNLDALKIAPPWER